VSELYGDRLYEFRDNVLLRSRIKTEKKNIWCKTKELKHELQSIVCTEIMI